MGCGYHGGSGHWERKVERMQAKMDRFRERMTGQGSGFSFGAPSSGNRERLRMAKDKSEFDHFMAERRDRPNQSAQPQS